MEEVSLVALPACLCGNDPTICGLAICGRDLADCPDLFQCYRFVGHYINCTLTEPDMQINMCIPMDNNDPGQVCDEDERNLTGMILQ